jgi:xylan 1,4-beta-xylosidase
MNRTQILLLGVIAILFSFAELQGQNPGSGSSPVFSRFVYEGDDQVYKDYPLEHDEFYTPILQGCYPDPAIVRR